jgi:esterase/lipase superfamily enzyme
MTIATVSALAPLYDAPDMDAKVAVMLDPGTWIEIIANSDDGIWCQVIVVWNGEPLRIGWIPAKLLIIHDGSGLAPTENPALREAFDRQTAENPKDRDNAEYVVWYGTNRAPISLSDRTQGYSTERDSETHYGTCRVFVPKSHKIGSLGSSLFERLLTMTDDRLKLLSVDTLVESTFWWSLAEKLASVADEDRHAVVFLHGFNVSFEQAALRAAQLGFDLSIQGVMAFFSWPSQGELSLSGYLADEASIEASEFVITKFLEDFVSASQAKAVHVIAHSMGNRGLLRAVRRIADRARERTGKHFDQIILAAADVDVDVFRQLCDAYAQVSRRATLYVSQKDRAVSASRWLYRFPRVGYAPPVFIREGMDTINVTNIDLTLLGHGYISEARDVLQDMHNLIVNNSPPERRFGLRPVSTGAGRYWLVGA